MSKSIAIHIYDSVNKKHVVLVENFSSSFCWRENEKEKLKIDLRKALNYPINNSGNVDNLINTDYITLYLTLSPR